MRHWLAAGVVGLVFGMGMLAIAAPRNRTIVIDGASAEWERLCFEKDGATIRASILAHAKQADGGASPEVGVTSFTLNAAQANTVNTFASGAALTRWRTERDLEQ